MTEHEEAAKESARSLAVVQVRTKYLEEENTNLQQRIESLTKQKLTLDRLVKEYQLERHKEVSNISTIYVVLHNKIIVW